MKIFKIKKNIYKVLKKLKYSKYTRTVVKNNQEYQYINWAICWDKLKQEYPNARHEWVMYHYNEKPYGGIMQPDGTVTVHAKIYYHSENGNVLEHNEYLSVKDDNNNPIVNPNSSDMEKAYRRALAKAISTLTGFGIELWIDNDIKSTRQSLIKANKESHNMMTYRQRLKLCSLIKNPHISESDKKQLKIIKDAAWEGITKQMASMLITDIMTDIKINKFSKKK